MVPATIRPAPPSREVIAAVRSPLITLFLVVLGWPLAVLLVLAGYTGVRDWLRAEYPSPPPPAAARPALQHPGYRPITEQALARYAALPAGERDQLRRVLQAHLLPAAEWLSRLDRSGFQVLCLGEDHAEPTRRYLARELMPRLRYQRLLLEATPQELARVRQKVASGRSYFPLLGADVAAILREAAARDPAVAVAGIEETGLQREQRRAGSASRRRDDAIVENFDSRFRPGERHLVLLGAFHCSATPGWLFHTLRTRPEPPAGSGLLSLRIVEAQAEGPVEAFVGFVRAIGVPSRDFVVADLPPPLRDWFPLLRQTTLERFDALLVFQQEASPSAPPQR